MRRTIQAFVPAHFRNPAGLALRLMRTRRAEAIHAMLVAAFGALLAPLDLALVGRERDRLARAHAPRLPILFVMGPPRSGTTLVALSLIRSLPVVYLPNGTALFPRAPIEALHRFGARIDSERVTLESFYGRTRGLDGVNDGLHLWDRWLGADRAVSPRAIAPEAAASLWRFFGAFEQAFGGPLVTKNNSLNGCAQLVAPLLPTARFVCLSREPLWLAASLLEARRFIHGDLRRSYGVDDPERPSGLDPIDDVARQVAYYDSLRAKQRAALGPRLREIAYEDFCADPATHVVEMGRTLLGLAPDASKIRDALPPFAASHKRTLPAGEFARLERAVADAFSGRRG